MSHDKLKLGVMGWPVRQSRSPELFYETFAGRPDVLDHFSYDLLEESDFDRALERFDREYYAVNVTIPYKEPAFRAAEEASALCRTVGAANLLIHQGGRVVAHNTDIIAVAEILRNHLAEPLREQESPICTPEAVETGLREQKCPICTPDDIPTGLRVQEGPICTPEAVETGLRVQEGSICTPEAIETGLRVQEGPICTPRPKVLVVGCGGAGKAAAAAAISIGASVTIANRTAETAISFIDHIKKSHSVTVRFSPLNTLPDEVRRADFIIYTLPVAVPELDHCDFNGKTILEAKYYDTSVKPAPGMTYIPGTEWLRLQALATYRILGL